MNAYLVVGDIVVGAHALDLRRSQHPADIVNDLEIGGRGLQRQQTALSAIRSSGRKAMATYLLELEELRGLHQVLELQSSLWHVVRLAPFLYTSDVVLDLHR